MNIPAKITYLIISLSLALVQSPAGKEISKEVSRARDLILQQKHAEALAALEPLAASNPSDVLVNELRSLALLELHRYGEAKVIFEKLKLLEPRSEAHRIGLARALEMLGNHDGAAAELEGALQLNATNPDALFSIGQIEVRRGNDTKAKDYFTKSLVHAEWSNTAPGAHYALSQIAARAGDAAESRRQRDLYHIKFKWAEKRSAYEKRIAINSGDASAFRALAALYREAGDGKSAVRLLEGVARAMPLDLLLKIEFAESKELASDRKGAMSAAEDALKVNANFLPALRWKAHALVQSSELLEALQILQRAADLDPNASAEPKLRGVTDELIVKLQNSNHPDILEAAKKLRKSLGK
ncbi:MAG: tetratricopeptide repeat protein [Planctomycetota bacterium]